ncbi:MAG: RsbRD N-terminal domain-containing protein [Dissulfurimicrobium sp.]|uniref:RsbRD N-terminal domain-containing protein n=1 Tax=Dissulfurimicrobium sp. TaxID=2022436 RepID=UPI00404A89D5
MNNLLREGMPFIKDRWFRLILETYPPESAKFMSSQKDRFANPMGSMFLNAIGPVVDELFDTGDPEKVKGPIEEIMKIRAVQDFEPSGAVSIFFLLKKAIREYLLGQKDANGGLRLEDILFLESRVDLFVLAAFDVYMKCRERIWEIKFNDLMKRPFILSSDAMCPSYLLKKGMTKERKIVRFEDGNNHGLS